MGYTPLHLITVNNSLVGFTGVAIMLEGLMCMRVEFRTPSCTISLTIHFLIVNVISAYNVILGKKNCMSLMQLCGIVEESSDQ
jgi:hypothetical protein